MPETNRPNPVSGAPRRYQRGRKIDVEKLARLKKAANQRNAARLNELPQAAEKTYDVRIDQGLKILVNDQGSCGDCYLISMLDVAMYALQRAGKLPPGEAGRLSGQWGLDCHPQLGGCNGGDEAEVAALLHEIGAPLASDYGAYSARPGHCTPIDPAKLHKIADWGFCDPGAQVNSVANLQKIKDCIKAWGPISVATATDGWDGYTGGVIETRSTAVDHAVIAIGWDDGRGKGGALKILNQWGGEWGDREDPGTCWVGYGCDSVGTEAIYVDGGAPLPPPPPPTPPGPDDELQADIDKLFADLMKRTANIPGAQAQLLLMQQIIDALLFHHQHKHRLPSGAEGPLWDFVAQLFAQLAASLRNEPLALALLLMVEALIQRVIGNL